VFNFSCTAHPRFSLAAPGRDAPALPAICPVKLNRQTGERRARCDPLGTVASEYAYSATSYRAIDSDRLTERFTRFPTAFGSPGTMEKCQSSVARVQDAWGVGKQLARVRHGQRRAWAGHHMHYKGCYCVHDAGVHAMFRACLRPRQSREVFRSRAKRPGLRALRL